jgi:hypothetical protein
LSKIWFTQYLKTGDSWPDVGDGLSNNNIKKVLYAMAVALENVMKTDAFIKFDDSWPL